MPGRGKLPVLAELAAPDSGERRGWSLRRDDLEALAPVCERLRGTRRLAVTGEDGRAAAVALDLAAAASAGGRRTALLECDLARPRLAAALGLARVPGLHEYLRWEATAPELLQPLVLAGPAARGAGEPLVCIAAGTPAPSPKLLLESESFRHAAARLGSAYELTVVLAPPLGEEELGLVAAAADALIVALDPSRLLGRPRRALRRTLRRLPAPPLGAVTLPGPAVP
jgi:Mrp family chromosome partitioning ATPase